MRVAISTVIGTAFSYLLCLMFWGIDIPYALLFPVLIVNLIFWIINVWTHPIRYFKKDRYDTTTRTTKIDLDTGKTTTYYTTPQDKADNANTWLNLFLTFPFWAAGPISHIVVVIIAALKYKSIAAKVIAIVIGLIVIVLPVIGFAMGWLPFGEVASNN